ncbi:MAG: tetratricopeptide repeat protein [Elusimicrobia bacterium]|nr:tetratricopeptide repeat protein [Elusimicrobiota bacterium]
MSFNCQGYYCPVPTEDVKRRVMEVLGGGSPDLAQSPCPEGGGWCCVVAECKGWALSGDALLRELSAVAGEAVRIGVQADVSFFAYDHWAHGVPIRALAYLEDRWSQVQGAPEEWEAEAFFPPGRLEELLRDPWPEAEAAVMRRVFAAKTLEEGVYSIGFDVELAGLKAAAFHGVLFPPDRPNPVPREVVAAAQARRRAHPLPPPAPGEENPPPAPEAPPAAPPTVSESSRRCAQGEALAAQGSHSEALAEFDAALAADRGCDPAVVGRVRCLMALERWKEALEAAAGQTWRQDTRLIYLKALCLGKLGRHFEAAQSLQAFLKRTPAGWEDVRAEALKRQPLMEARARAQERGHAGDAAGTARELQAVLALDPGDRESRRQLGIALAKTGQFTQALETFKLLLAEDPDDKLLNQHMGTLLLSELGRAAEALPYYERALEKDPAMVSALSGKRECLEQLGRLDDALRIVEQLLGLQAKSGGEILLLTKASLLDRLGRREEALAMARMALMAPNLRAFLRSAASEKARAQFLRPATSPAFAALLREASGG